MWHLVTPKYVHIMHQILEDGTRANTVLSMHNGTTLYHVHYENRIRINFIWSLADTKLLANRAHCDKCNFGFFMEHCVHCTVSNVVGWLVTMLFGQMHCDFIYSTDDAARSRWLKFYFLNVWLAPRSRFLLKWHEFFNTKACVTLLSIIID